MGNVCILIIDDNPIDVELLSMMLGDEGYCIEAIKDSQIAVESIAGNPPEIILLDINMPKVNGIEICRQVKNNPELRHIPIIFLSAFDDIETKEEGFAAGAEDYVTKPFHPEEVLARVRTQLRIRESVRQLELYHVRERAYLESLLAIRDDFITTTTHDLKNPLSLINVSVDLIRRYGPDNWDKVLQRLALIAEAVSDMSQLVGDILDLAHLEASASLIMTRFDLRRIVENAVSSIEHLAQQKGIDLRVDVPVSDVLIMGDSAKLSRVFENLLSNAIKYSPRNTSVLVLMREEEEKHLVEVQIRDQGYGIPGDEMDKIFNRFYRIGDEKHMCEKGTGLGLAIVKTIVEQHGGRILVESEPGKGSTFSVILCA